MCKSHTLTIRMVPASLRNISVVVSALFPVTLPTLLPPASFQAQTVNLSRSQVAGHVPQLLSAQLEAPAHLRRGDHSSELHISIRNSGTSGVTFCTRVRRLVFYDAMGNLLTNLKDYNPDVEEAGLSLQDILTLGAGESVRLSLRMGSFIRPPRVGQYLVEAQIRTVSLSRFPVTVNRALKADGIKLYNLIITSPRVQVHLD